MTRGKAPITQQIPDDTDSSYAAYKDAVQHAKADRTDADGVKAAIGGQQWDGDTHFCLQDHRSHHESMDVHLHMSWSICLKIESQEVKWNANVSFHFLRIR